MPVEIRELVTRVDVVDPESMLSPAVLEQIVTAVLDRLQAREQAGRARASGFVIESVVQEQRAKGGA